MVKLEGLTLEQWIAEGCVLGLEPIEVTRALEQTPMAKKVQPVLQHLRRDLENGVPFSEALARHPKVIGSELVSVVEGGETSGRLSAAASAFMRCEVQRESGLLDTLRLLAYPLLVFSIVLSPRFFALFSDDRLGAIPFFPAGMEHAFAIATYMSIGVVSAVLLLICGLIFRPRLVRPLATLLPGVSRVLLLRTTAFAADNLARMLRAGRPLADALRVASKSDGAHRLEKTVARIEAGAALSEAFDAGGRVGSLLRGPVTMTAARGDLPLSLERAAYELRVEAARIESVSRGAYWVLTLFLTAAFVFFVMYTVYSGQLESYSMEGVVP